MKTYLCEDPKKQRAWSLQLLLGANGSWNVQVIMPRKHFGEWLWGNEWEIQQI